MIVVVLVPDVVDNMLNDLLALTRCATFLFLELTDEQSSIDPLLIRLSGEYGEQDLRNVFGSDALVRVWMLSFVRPLCILEELHTWQLVVFVWLLLVEQLAANIDVVEEIGKLDVLRVDLAVIL